MVDSAPAEARARILDAAEELFAHHGYDATPTAKVAAAAGVPKGLVFYHFARKIDLLTALFEERMPAAVPHEVDDVVAPGTSPARCSPWPTGWPSRTGGPGWCAPSSGGRRTPIPRWPAACTPSTTRWSTSRSG